MLSTAVTRGDGDNLGVDAGTMDTSGGVHDVLGPAGLIVTSGTDMASDAVGTVGDLVAMSGDICCFGDVIVAMATSGGDLTGESTCILQ